jgi:hypothetical protein
MVMWLDFGSNEMCDVGEGGHTEIGVDERPKEGALFLALQS